VNDAGEVAEERVGPRRVKLLQWGGLAVAALGACIIHLAPALGFSGIAGWLPSYQLEASRISFAEAGNRVDPALSLATRRIAQGSPLEAVPLYYHAIEREEQASDDELLTLLDAVIKRDPRHYFARIWRARIYYRIGQMSDAVDEVLKVIPLNRSNANDYLEALVDIARDPKNQPLMLALVSEEPYWAHGFVNRAVTQIEDEAFSLALASRSQKTLNEYLRSLVQGGQYERAFLIWQSTLSDEDRLTIRWPIDPRFELVAEPGPFDWQTNNTMASRDPGGVRVYYNGRGARKVLSQTMLLGPGYRYRLSAQVSGEMKERGGWFRWRLVCLPSGGVLTEAPIRSAGSEDSAVTAEFAVPDTDCGAQSVELTAEPGEYLVPARLTVKEVRIDELGAVEETIVDSGAGLSSTP